MAASRVAVVVEDDREVAELIGITLGQAGFAVRPPVTDGELAVGTVARAQPDLLTLDLSLPGMDGVEICRRVREISDCYIIVLTGRQAEVDRLISLEVGADDVMLKPFSPRELRARVAALFRRPRAGVFSVTPTGPLDGGGGLTVDPARREVRVEDRPVLLTRTEFELLAHLVGREGVVCPRSQIIARIWQSEFVDDDHMIDVHVANLRRKLRMAAPHEWIRTVRGVGYLFDKVA